MAPAPVAELVRDDARDDRVRLREQVVEEDDASRLPEAGEERVVLRRALAMRPSPGHRSRSSRRSDARPLQPRGELLVLERGELVEHRHDHDREEQRRATRRRRRTQPSPRSTTGRSTASATTARAASGVWSSIPTSSPLNRSPTNRPGVCVEKPHFFSWANSAQIETGRSIDRERDGERRDDRRRGAATQPASSPTIASATASAALRRDDQQEQAGFSTSEMARAIVQRTLVVLRLLDLFGVEERRLDPPRSAGRSVRRSRSPCSGPPSSAPGLEVHGDGAHFTVTAVDLRFHRQRRVVDLGDRRVRAALRSAGRRAVRPSACVSATSWQRVIGGCDSAIFVSLADRVGVLRADDASRAASCGSCGSRWISTRASPSISARSSRSSSSVTWCASPSGVCGGTFACSISHVPSGCWIASTLCTWSAIPSRFAAANVRATMSSPSRLGSTCTVAVAPGTACATAASTASVMSCDCSTVDVRPTLTVTSACTSGARLTNAQTSATPTTPVDSRRPLRDAIGQIGGCAVHEDVDGAQPDPRRHRPT